KKRVLARGREDADRDSDGPREYQGESREDEREEEPLPYQLAVGAAPFERNAEVASQQVAHPFAVLDVHGLVQPVTVTQRFYLRLIDRGAASSQLGYVTSEEVARRRLNERERDDREDQEQERQQQ